MWVDVLFRYLAAAGLLHSSLLAVFLWRRPANRGANRVLAALICVISFQALLNAFDNQAFFTVFPHLTRVSWVLPSLFGPLVYVFAQKLTSPAPWRSRDTLHLLPFGGYMAVLLPYFAQSAAAKLALVQQFEASAKADFGWLTQLTPGIILLYFLATLRLLREHEHRLMDELSDIEQQRLLWLRQFVLAVIGILLVTAASFFGRKWAIPVLSALYHYPYLLVLLLVYWIGYKALFQQQLLNPAPDPAPPVTQAPAPAKYQKTALTPLQLDTYRAQVVAYMEANRPYLSSDVSLQTLAEQMQLPRHHLSQTLNEALGVNFFDFVNGYRVAAASNMLLDPGYAHYTVLAIGLEAGFNSKTTFNAVFREKTGLTPTEFRKKAGATL